MKQAAQQSGLHSAVERIPPEQPTRDGLEDSNWLHAVPDAEEEHRVQNVEHADDQTTINNRLKSTRLPRSASIIVCACECISRHDLSWKVSAFILYFICFQRQ